jgi:hypothetical protein
MAETPQHTTTQAASGTKTTKREATQMNNEYEQQAQEFLNRTKTRMDIVPGAPKGYVSITGGNAYTVTLTNLNHTYTFGYSGSIHDKRLGRSPTQYDVLATLTKYPQDQDIREFAEAYGYTLDDALTGRLQQNYYAVQDEYRNVTKLWPDKADMDELLEIA